MIGGKPRAMRDIGKAFRHPHRFAHCRFACATGTAASQGFRPGARGVATLAPPAASPRRVRGIESHAPRLNVLGRPKALGSRRSGRAGEPAAGESVRASESRDDPSSAAAALPLRRVDVPHRPRLPSYHYQRSLV